MNLAPIVLFVYNRPEHTMQTLCALAENELAKDSILYIYADGPKENASRDDLRKLKETRELIKTQTWCKEVHVIESIKNKGLASSVIEGVSEITKKHGRVIVLEDELITSKGFLKYMNDGLQLFSDTAIVMQICGHCLPAEHISKKNSSFFIPLCTSWGWATWERAWKKFDIHATGYQQLKSDKALETRFNLNNSFPYSKMLLNQMELKNIDSWAIRWWWSFFKENGIGLFPDKSLVKNIGFGIHSTHTRGKDPYFIKDFDPNYFINTFPSDTSINENYFEQIKLCILNSTTNNNHSTTKLYFPTFIKKMAHKLNRFFNFNK